MKYQVTIKNIPEQIFYVVEKRLAKYSDMMHVIPAIDEEFKKLNPNLKCAEPPYEFCEYPDGEYRESNVLIRMKYAEENGYKIAGFSRECYIDGIWNKDSVDDWLTEIQLPIE